MKKVVVVLCMMCCLVGAFAKTNTFEIGYGFNDILETVKYDGNRVKTNLLGTGFVLAGSTVKDGEAIGTYASVGFNMPQKIKLTVNGESAFATKNDFSQLWSLDLLVGPCFDIVKTEKNVLTVAAGYHMALTMIASEDDVTLVPSSGLGVNLSYAYYLTDGFYVKVGSDFAYDFYNVINQATLSMLFVTPKISIGFRN